MAGDERCYKIQHVEINQGQDSRKNKDKVPWLRSHRLLIAVTSTLGSIILYAMIGNIAEALICMTTNTNDTREKDDSFTFGVPHANLTNSFNFSSHASGEFDWSRDTQGWILSSYSIGYCSSVFVGGYLCAKFGARNVILGAYFVLTLATLFTPFAADIHVAFLITAQTLKGCAAGLITPCFYQIIAKWMPCDERTLVMGMLSMGPSGGTVVGDISSGLLCHGTFAGGWPGIFYSIGIASSIWCLVWFLVGFNCPDEHPWISEIELNYINNSLQHTSQTQTVRIPWCKIFTTPAVYAGLFAMMCFAWLWFVSVSCFPQYLHDVLKLDVEENSLYHSLPFIANAVMSIPCSLVLNTIIRKNILSTTRARKLSETISLLLSAGIAMGIGYLTKDAGTFAIVLLAFWGGLLAFSNAGIWCIFVDMAPRFSGVTMGISLTFYGGSGILAPIATSAMTPNGSAEEWQVVFYTCAAIAFSGWLVFVIFATSEEQPWATEEPFSMGINDGDTCEDNESDCKKIKEEIPTISVAHNITNDKTNAQVENETVTSGGVYICYEPETLSCYL